MIVAGSRCGSNHRMQLDDHCGKLRLVESLNAAGWSLWVVEVGRVVECSWMIIVGSWGWLSYWSAARRLLWETGVGRVVECSWLIVSGSWARSSHSSAARRLLREAEVGADISEIIAMAVPHQSCADVSGTAAMALMCQSCVDVSETVAKALPCQSSAVSSRQARRPRLRLAVS